MRFVANQKKKKIVAQARLDCVFGKKAKHDGFVWRRTRVSFFPPFGRAMTWKTSVIKLLSCWEIHERKFHSSLLTFFFFQNFVLHHVIHKVLLLPDWVLGSTYYLFFCFDKLHE